MKFLFLFLVFVSSGLALAQTADFTASPTTICVGGSVQFNDASTGATSWSWTFIDGASGQSSSIPNPLITYSIPGTYAVILTVTNGVTSDTENKPSFITVLNTASVTLTSPVGSNNQSTCLNLALGTPITYTILGVTGATFSGLPPGINGSFVSAPGGIDVTINGTPTAIGTYNYTVTSTGGTCAPVSTSGTIIVEDAPAIALTSAVGTDNQAVCINTAITNITYSISGAATGASVTGLPAGVSGSFAAGTFTISGTPTVAGTFNYTVTTTGGTCPAVSANGTITVENLPTVVLTTAAGTDNQTVCENTAITMIQYALGGSATFANVTGLPAGTSFSVFAGTLTISGTPTLAGTYNYTVTTSGGTCTPATATGTIVVEVAPGIALSSVVGTDNQTVCINTAITTITYSVSGAATGATVTGLPAGVSGSFAAGTFTISGTPTVAGSFNYTVTTSGGTCPAVTANGTIAVDNLPTVVLTTAAGTDNQTVCENTAITMIQYALGGSATFANVTGLPAGTSFSVFAGTLTISGTPTLAGTYNYTVTTSGGTCTPATATGTIVVEVAPGIALSSVAGTDNQTVCINTAITTITYSVSGSATGASVTGLPAGVSGSFAAGTFTIAGTPTVAGTFNYTVTTSGGTCPAVTANGTIAVDNLPTVVLTTAAGTDNQTVCENTAITMIQYALGGSATFANVTGLPAGTSFSVFAGTLTISGTPTLAGTYNYTVTTSGGTCTPATATGTIVVEVAPGIALSSVAGTDNQTVCINTTISNITYSVSGSATGATVTGLPAGVSGSFSAGTFTISGTPTVVGTFNYTVTTSGGTCPAVTANGTIDVQSMVIQLASATYTNDQTVCVNSGIDSIFYNISGSVSVNDLPAGVVTQTVVGTPNQFIISGIPSVSGTFYYTIQSNTVCGWNLVVGQITVLPSITGNTSGSAATICSGSDFTLTGGALSTSPAPYVYQWESSSSLSGPFTPAAGINSASNYTNSLSITDTMVFFRRIVTNGTCGDTTIAVQISVDSLPTLTSPISSSICSNDSLTISGIAVSNGNIGNWTTMGSGQLLNPSTSSPTYIPAANEAGSTILLNFEVTSNNTCAPSTIAGEYFITILNNPVATGGGMMTVCANNMDVVLLGATANYGTGNWTFSGNGSLINPTSASPSYRTVTTDMGDTINVYFVVTTSTCTVPMSDSVVYVIMVDSLGINPGLIAFAGEDETISLGNSVELNATGTAITTWNWSPSIGLSDSTISNPIAQPIVTTDYVLTVTDINGCMDTDSLRIIVDTDFEVYIPNLFSPNGDGKNDTWEIPQLANYPNTRVNIINREGIEVFGTENYTNNWDGTFKGKALPEATYYYLIQFENSDQVYKGAVSILRNKN